MVIILPDNPPYSEKLRAFIAPLLGAEDRFLDPREGLSGLGGEKIIFAVALDEGGCSIEYYGLLSVLRRGAGLISGLYLLITDASACA